MQSFDVDFDTSTFLQVFGMTHLRVNTIPMKCKLNIRKCKKYVEYKKAESSTIPFVVLSNTSFIIESFRRYREELDSG